MPLTGNRLGSRGRYVYESDEPGKGFILTTDEDLAVAGTGQGAAAPITYDPASPPVGIELCPPPKRFKPRVVFIQAADGSRKDLICFSPVANLYASTVPQSVTIDELAFETTGRRGEKISF